jgi:hypothetical protein
MTLHRWIAGTAALAASGAAWAGGSTVPLGTPVGTAVGQVVGSAVGFVLSAPLGITVGGALPIAGSGLLLVGTGSLALGIWIVRRKRKR